MFGELLSTGDMEDKSAEDLVPHRVQTISDGKIRINEEILVALRTRLERAGDRDRETYREDYIRVRVEPKSAVLPLLDSAHQITAPTLSLSPFFFKHRHSTASANCWATMKRLPRAWKLYRKKLPSCKQKAPTAGKPVLASSAWPPLPAEWSVFQASTAKALQKPAHLVSRPCSPSAISPLAGGHADTSPQAAISHCSSSSRSGRRKTSLQPHRIC